MSHNRHSSRDNEASTLYKMEKEAENIRAIRHEAMEHARHYRDSIQNRSFDDDDNDDDRNRRNGVVSSNKVLSSKYGRRYSATSSSANNDGIDDDYGMEDDFDGDENNSHQWENQSKLAKALRRYRDRCGELESKLRETMLLQAQVDNEKLMLRYELDLVRDYVEDISDTLISYQRLYSEKKKEWSYQRMQINDLQKDVDNLRKALEARDQLISEHGFILIGCKSDDNSSSSATVSASSQRANDKTIGNNNKSCRDTFLLSSGLLEKLSSLPGDTLEAQLSTLLTTFSRIKSELKEINDERRRDDSFDSSNSPHRLPFSPRFNNRSGTPSGVVSAAATVGGTGTTNSRRSSLVQTHRRSSIQNFLEYNQNNTGETNDGANEEKKESDEWKSQFHRSQSALTSVQEELKSTADKLNRTETQAKRYKNISETLEKNMEELKTDKRKIQRELREANSKADDLRSQLELLQRKFNRMQSRTSQ